MGNVSCRSGATSGGKGCEERRQVQGTETPTWDRWFVVPQKVTPNSSPVMCQYKSEWQFNISNVIPEERLKQVYQLVCATRRGRARVRQNIPSDQAIEEWRRLAESINHSLLRYTGVAALKQRTTQRRPQANPLVPLLMLEVEERGTATARWRLRQLLL